MVNIAILSDGFKRRLVTSTSPATCLTLKDPSCQRGLSASWGIPVHKLPIEASPFKTWDHSDKT